MPFESYELLELAQEFLKDPKAFCIRYRPLTRRLRGLVKEKGLLLDDLVKDHGLFDIIIAEMSCTNSIRDTHLDRATAYIIAYCLTCTGHFVIIPRHHSAQLYSIADQIYKYGKEFIKIWRQRIKNDFDDDVFRIKNDKAICDRKEDSYFNYLAEDIKKFFDHFRGNYAHNRLKNEPEPAQPEFYDKKTGQRLSIPSPSRVKNENEFFGEIVRRSGNTNSDDIYDRYWSTVDIIQQYWQALEAYNSQRVRLKASNANQETFGEEHLTIIIEWYAIFRALDRLGIDVGRNIFLRNTLHALIAFLRTYYRQKYGRTVSNTLIKRTVHAIEYGHIRNASEAMKFIETHQPPIKLPTRISVEGLLTHVRYGNGNVTTLRYIQRYYAELGYIIPLYAAKRLLYDCRQPGRRNLNDMRHCVERYVERLDREWNLPQAARQYWHTMDRASVKDSFYNYLNQQVKHYLGHQISDQACKALLLELHDFEFNVSRAHFVALAEEAAENDRRRNRNRSRSSGNGSNTGTQNSASSGPQNSAASGPGDIVGDPQKGQRIREDVYKPYEGKPLHVEKPKKSLYENEYVQEAMALCTNLAITMVKDSGVYRTFRNPEMAKMAREIQQKGVPKTAFDLAKRVQQQAANANSNIGKGQAKGRTPDPSAEARFRKLKQNGLQNANSQSYKKTNVYNGSRRAASSKMGVDMRGTGIRGSGGTSWKGPIYSGWGAPRCK